MNCNDCDKLFDDYLDGELDSIRKNSVQSHLQACSACAEKYQQLSMFQQKIRNLPVPPPRAGYEDRVLSFLHEDAMDKPKSGKHWFAAGFGAALAASLTVWLVLSPVMQKPEEKLELVTIQLAPEKVQKVNLVFSSPVQLKKATLRIDLPENIEIAGFPGQRYIQWTTSIKAGSNRLALPLVAKKASAGILKASLSKGEQKKILQIRLNASDRHSLRQARYFLHV